MKRSYSAADKAYAAAILDGEGWMYANLIIRKDTGYSNPQFRIGVANKSLKLLEWLQSRFGGKIYKNADFDSRGVRTWTITKSSEMLWFLQQIRPYMIIKGPVADKMIEFLELRLNGAVNRMSDEAKAIIEEIKHMNVTQCYLS